MKIFISWSGERSRAVANILRDWLPDLIEGLEVWTASKDIEAGQRWSTIIGTQLESADFGILCITPKNVIAPWLLFEAGALSKSLSVSKVIPYLIDLTPAELEGPLAQFQSVTSDKNGTFQLARSILLTRDGNNNGEERLKRVFDSLWDNLEEASRFLPYEGKTPSTHELVKACLSLLSKQEEWRTGQQLQSAHARLLFESIANIRHDERELTDSAKEAVLLWIKRRTELEEKIRPLREKSIIIENEIERYNANYYNTDELEANKGQVFFQMGSIELEIQNADQKLIEELNASLPPKTG